MGLDSKFYIPIQKLKFGGGLPLEILLDCNMFPLFESLDCNSGKTGTDTHPESPIQAKVQNWDLIDGPPIKLLEFFLEKLISFTTKIHSLNRNLNEPLLA